MLHINFIFFSIKSVTTLFFRNYQGQTIAILQNIDYLCYTAGLHLKFSVPASISKVQGDVTKFSSCHTPCNILLHSNLWTA